jgi:aminopeptidase-like protein
MIGGQTDGKMHELAMLWVLNLSDGNHTLLDIAERSGLEFGVISSAAGALLKYELLQAC